MLSVGAIHFEDRFCASKKGGIGGGGRVSAQGAVRMAAALAGCRKALVGTGLSISLPFATNGRRQGSPAPFYELHFWHCRQLSVGRSIHRSEGPDHCKLANEWA